MSNEKEREYCNALVKQWSRDNHQWTYELLAELLRKERDDAFTNGRVSGLEENYDQINAWKEASGLIRGGDPDAVTPADLTNFVRHMDEIVRLSRLLVEFPDSKVFATNLSCALAKLDAKWPEE